ncbi:MAG TPA: nickel ABC transporter permease [Thermoanaerobaculia bacterium]|nr:nickel ABC transporter permease [Thermoanaerobaculia bacterium]
MSGEKVAAGTNVGQYILRRFLQMIPITFGILTLVFSLIHLIPGDPARQIAGENAREEDIVAVRKALGLDQPLWSQYVNYLSHVVRGDLGRSFQTNESVSKQIAQRYPATIQLAFGAMFVALLVAFPLGIISAIYRNSWIDNVARFFALIGVSMPSFWFGPLLIIAFAINHTWFPVSGRDQGLRSLVLPSLTMGLALAAILTRMIRVSLAEELTQLYVTTAIAKGVTRAKAIFRHALKNALIPVITVLALQFGSLLTGAIITEQIFSWPGLGRLLITSISNRDYPQVQASILVIALTYILVNFISDLLYGVVDPRIKLG